MTSPTPRGGTDSGTDGGEMSPLLSPTTRLHVVTGKGGTGKSTVAAALAVMLAERGRKVLLCEVEDRGAIAATFGCPPPAPEQEIAHVKDGVVNGLLIDAKSALREYLIMFFKLGRATGALERLGAVDFATTIAPGLRDLLLLGKVYEAVQRPAATPNGYDAVVLDAPPTGRVVQFLTVSGAVGDLAKVGPIHAQSRSMTALLRSRACAVHLVTLPEEMPVQETSDAVTELRDARLPIGAVFVNKCAGEELSPATVAALEGGALTPEMVGADLARLGLAHDNDTVNGLIQQGLRQATRLSKEDAMLDKLDELNLPQILLPSLRDAHGLDALNRLADETRSQVTL